MIDIDQRMFYLMLSATEGQEFARSMGFATPSIDVQELEIMDVLSRWLVVAKSGIFDEVREASQWFVDFLEKTDKLTSPSEDFMNALTVFSIALVNKLLENGYIGLLIDDEKLSEITDIEDLEEFGYE